MGQVFAAFERYIGAGRSFNYILPDGSRLVHDDTMESRGLMDGDAIDAKMEQVGC